MYYLKQQHSFCIVLSGCGLVRLELVDLKDVAGLTILVGATACGSLKSSNSVLRRSFTSHQAEATSFHLFQYHYTALASSSDFVFFFSELQHHQTIRAQLSLHRHTRPSFTTTMEDDDDTRKLILRLQMEDLASIWASSTTSTDDGTELDADVSLRLYRQELRTAEQQIEDEHSAQAAAQDEHRQRDAILADREAARRLFLELNPNEPLPEFVDNDQLAIIESSTSDNALLMPEASSAPGLRHSTDQSSTPSGPSSLFSRRTSLTSSGMKRSADHLDTDDEPSTKKQASEGTVPASGQFSARELRSAQRASSRSIRSTPANPFGSVQAFNSSPSTPTGLKRPALDELSDVHPRRDTNPRSRTLPLFGIHHCLRLGSSPFLLRLVLPPHLKRATLPSSARLADPRKTSRKHLVPTSALAQYVVRLRDHPFLLEPTEETIILQALQIPKILDRRSSQHRGSPSHLDSSLSLNKFNPPQSNASFAIARSHAPSLTATPAVMRTVRSVPTGSSKCLFMMTLCGHHNAVQQRCPSRMLNTFFAKT